jgi:hypothetical protein
VSRVSLADRFKASSKIRELLPIPPRGDPEACVRMRGSYRFCTEMPGGLEAQTRDAVLGEVCGAETDLGLLNGPLIVDGLRLLSRIKARKDNRLPRQTAARRFRPR